MDIAELAAIGGRVGRCVALLLLAIGCAAGPGRGPNPAFVDAPNSCSRMGAAWEQHGIETMDQLNTPGLFEPGVHSVSDAARLTVLLPFALTSDAVALVGFGAAGSLAMVPVNYTTDARPHECWGKEQTHAN